VCLNPRAQSLRQRVQGRVIRAMSQLAQQRRAAFIRRGHGQGEGQLLSPPRTQLLMGRQFPALPQRTAPVTVARVLPIPLPEFNDARASIQMKPIRVAMDQPPLALGGKPRLEPRRVVAVALAVVAASIPDLPP
jgi:hypothetical protein